MLIKVLAPGYFARQDTKTPVKIGIFAMAANMVFNLALVFPLAHAGLALATSLSAWLNAGLLWRGLIKEGVWRWQSGWPVFLLRIGVANAALAGVISWFQPPLEQWLNADGFQRSADMAILVTAGVAVYFIALAAMGLRVRHFRHR
jgi:putative peptidoglycan lipid II flippase